MAAGYSDSSVNKETPTIQVTNLDTTTSAIESVSSDAQVADVAEFSAPDLGMANTNQVFKSVKIGSASVVSNLKPPEFRRQKSVYIIYEMNMVPAL